MLKLTKKQLLDLATTIRKEHIADGHAMPSVGELYMMSEDELLDFVCIEFDGPGLGPVATPVRFRFFKQQVIATMFDEIWMHLAIRFGHLEELRDADDRRRTMFLPGFRFLIGFGQIIGALAEHEYPLSAEEAFDWLLSQDLLVNLDFAYGRYVEGD